jgi:DNA-binding HxlR family transcriptional regulator
MDTVKILNNYRLSLSNDKYALLILTILFRSGAQSEIDLFSKLNISKTILQEKLNHMYKAQLICIVQKNKWTTTDLAEEIISRLGVLEAVSRSVLNDLNLNEIDRSFLQACIEFQSIKKPEWSRFQASMLRNIDLMKDNLLKESTKSKQKRAQLLFSSIVGMDSDIQQLGEKQFYFIVLNWHKSRNTELWQENKSSWQEDKNIIFNRCKLAKKDVQLSNQMMLIDDEFEYQIKFTKRSYGLTLTRLIAALTSNYVDNGCIASSQINKKFYSDIWDTIGNEYPNITKKTNELFSLLGKTETDNLSDWEKTIRLRLKDLINQAYASNRETGIGEMAISNNMSSVAEALGPAREKWIKSTLERMISQINEGHFDNLSISSVKKIKRLLGNASRGLSKRFDKTNSN